MASTPSLPTTPPTPIPPDVLDELTRRVLNGTGDALRLLAREIPEVAANGELRTLVSQAATDFQHALVSALAARPSTTQGEPVSEEIIRGLADHGIGEEVIGTALIAFHRAAMRVLLTELNRLVAPQDVVALLPGFVDTALGQLERSYKDAMF